MKRLERGIHSKICRGLGQLPETLNAILQAMTKGGKCGMLQKQRCRPEGGK